MKIDCNTDIAALMGDLSAAERVALVEGQEAHKRGAIAREQQRQAQDMVLRNGQAQVEKLKEMADMSLGSTVFQAGLQAASEAMNIANACHTPSESKGFFDTAIDLITAHEFAKINEITQEGIKVLQKADGFKLAGEFLEVDKQRLATEEKAQKYAVEAADQQIDHVGKLADKANDRQHRMARLIHEGQMALLRG